MPSYVTPKKNTAFIVYVGLPSQGTAYKFQSNPTLAAGDAKVSIDGAALANLATLPAVTPASSKMVKISLSAAEMNGDNITVVLSDAAGDEWCDVVMNIQTSARQVDDLAFPNTSGRGMDVDASGGVEVGSFQAGAITAAAHAAGAIDAAALAADAGTEIATAVWASGTRSLTVLDEDSTTLDLDATIRAAVGLASANLDTQLTTIDDFLDTEVAAIKAKTDSLTFTVAGQLDANVISWTGTAAQGAAGRPQVDVELWLGSAPNALSSGRLDATVGAMQANVMTAASAAADLTTELQTGLATAAALAVVDGIVDDILLDTAEIGTAGAGLTNINLPNQTMDIVGNITGNLSGSVGSVTAGVSLAASAVQAIWDALTSALTTVGSVGKVLVDNVNATISSRASQTSLDTVDDFLDTEVAAIKAKTDNLPSDPADASVIAGRFDTLDTSVADLPTNAELATALAAADDATLAAIAALNNLSAAQVNAEVDTALADYDGPTHAELTAGLAAADDAVLAQVALVKAKTDALPSDPADASVVAGLIAAVEAKVDVIDTVVDAVLVDTAEIGVAGAGLTALPWNAAWDAEVQSEATDALVSYDPPTHAELTAGLAAADDAVLAAIAALTIPTASANASALLAAAFEGAETVQDFLRLSRAVLYGESTGQATGTVNYRDKGDTKNRVIGSVDVDGNRTAVTLDAT